MKISYDLHMHSCLSPCGDNDMTPNNIVNMARLLGLDVIALSDHNSALNLPSFIKIAAAAGLSAIPAIEVTTSEEVHMLCLFLSLEGALEFSEYIHTLLPPIKNKTELFGDQLILDENDQIIGHEDLLLINAASIGVEQLLKLRDKYGFFVLPAHVDKNANSIISNLGFIPPEYDFSCIEVKMPEKIPDFAKSEIENFRGNIITNSDAHYLEHIHEPTYFIEADSAAPADVIAALKKAKCG